MTAVLPVKDFPCRGCAGLIRFKTQEQLDTHSKAVHPPDSPLRGLAATQKEATLATKPTTAQPENCRLCARHAPEKCKRHGGPSRSLGVVPRAARQARAQGKAPCSHCHRTDGTHTANCRSLGATKPQGKALAFTGVHMLRAAVQQLEAELGQTQALIKKAQAFAKEIAG